MALASPTQLRGRSLAWGTAGVLVLAGLTLLALYLRVRGLAAEGFSDDEVHKWLAAVRYLRGDFGGDDLEHPMLMKSLTAVAALLLRGQPMETVTRLPAAVAGALLVPATALLGRRLFGRAAGLMGAALMAVAPSIIAYHRVAKEDSLLGLFMALSLWALAEARAAAEDGRAEEQARWERWSAVAIGAAFASKYFVFYFPIPLLAYLWLRPVSAWRVPARRWAALVAVAVLVLLALDWVVLRPSTWNYWYHYMRADLGGDRGVSESTVFLGRSWGNLGLSGEHTPWWFFGAFLALKFTPAVPALALAGLAWALARRAPAHRIVLVWLAIFLGFTLVAGVRYSRYLVSVLPAIALLAGHAAAELVGALAPRLRLPAPAALAVAGVLLALPEARAAQASAPYHRLYLTPLAGRDSTYYFPQDDCWDLGVREAVGWLAAHAEQGAEVASETSVTVELYAAAAGRPDLRAEPLLPGRACAGGGACYVLVQPGRRYWHNQAALERLAQRSPAHVVEQAGLAAVRIHRLDPGQDPFPPAPVTAPAPSAAR